MSSNPSSEPSSGRQDDGVVALGSAYRFFGAAPAWVLSGLGLAVVLVQAMWLTGWNSAGGPLHATDNGSISGCVL